MPSERGTSKNKGGENSGENESFREKFEKILSGKEEEEGGTIESEEETSEEFEEAKETELREPEFEEGKLEREEHAATETSDIGWVQEVESKIINRHISREADRFFEKFDLDEENLDTEEIAEKPYIRLERSVPLLRGTKEVKVVNRPYSGRTVEDGDFDSEDHEIASAISEIFDGEKKVIKKDGVTSLIVDVDGDTVVVSVNKL